jgi:hypothetical protein
MQRTSKVRCTYVNLFGLPDKGTYDNFLILVSFIFNALTVWYAWGWVA